MPTDCVANPRIVWISGNTTRPIIVCCIMQVIFTKHYPGTPADTGVAVSVSARRRHSEFVTGTASSEPLFLSRLWSCCTSMSPSSSALPTGIEMEGSRSSDFILQCYDVNSNPLSGTCNVIMPLPLPILSLTDQCSRTAKQAFTPNCDPSNQQKQKEPD